MQLWDVVCIDLSNLVKFIGNELIGKKVVKDFDDWFDVFNKVLKVVKIFVVLLFDLVKDIVFISGNKGGLQVIINVVGGQNVVYDVNDMWVRISWEKVVIFKFDVIVFVDYDVQFYFEKVKIL